MKHITTQLILFFLAAFCMIGCSKDDVPPIPNLSKDEQPPVVEEKTITLQELITLYKGEPILFEEIDDGTNLTTAGIVISSDEHKNIQSKLHIQNAANNPTLGVSILIDVPELYRSYAFGDKITLKLDGLALHLLDGEWVIGVMRGDDIVPILADHFEDFVTNTRIKETVEPLAVKAAAVQSKLRGDSFTDPVRGIFVRLDSVQLVEQQLGLSFAGTEENKIVDRRILSCADNANFDLKFNGSSNFKAQPFPQGDGAVQGIIKSNSKNFALYINSPDDILISDTLSDRCGTVSKTIFEEDFEKVKKIGDSIPLKLSSWINYAGKSAPKESKQTLWQVVEDGKSKVAQIQGPKDKEFAKQSSATWLILPKLTVKGKNEAILKFELKIPYFKKAGLKIKVSIDFEGNNADVNRSEQWTTLKAPDIPEAVTEKFETIEVPIDLTAFKNPENIHVAFNFEGKGRVAQYQIDSIVLEAE